MELTTFMINDAEYVIDVSGVDGRFSTDMHTPSGLVRLFHDTLHGLLERIRAYKNSGQVEQDIGAIRIPFSEIHLLDQGGVSIIDGHIVGCSYGAFGKRVEVDFGTYPLTSFRQADREWFRTPSDNAKSTWMRLHREHLATEGALKLFEESLRFDAPGEFEAKLESAKRTRGVKVRDPEQVKYGEK